MLHQRIGLGELRGAAIGQAVFGAAFAALTGDAIRVGEGQQCAQPTTVLGITHRLADRYPAQVTLELPGQLPGALYAAIGAARSPALTRQQRQAAVQIGATATLDVALAQQGRQVTGQLTEAQGLPAQQQVCLLYTSPSPRDLSTSRMPSSA